MVFLKVLKAAKRREREMRLLMLGLDNAGKTTVLKKISGEATDEVSPTLGFSIKTLQHKGFQLHTWDVGGQKTIRAFWKNYFEETDGLIWVVDSADVSRLANCKEELQKLLREERLAGCSLLVLANKNDLAGSAPVGMLRQYLELDAIKTHHWTIQGCSALTGEGLLEGFDWLVDDIAERVQLL